MQSVRDFKHIRYILSNKTAASGHFLKRLKLQSTSQCYVFILISLQLNIQILIKSSINISHSHCMASNYLCTGGNILLSLGGVPEKKIRYFLGGGGPEKNGNFLTSLPLL